MLWFEATVTPAITPGEGSKIFSGPADSIVRPELAPGAPPVTVASEGGACRLNIPSSSSFNPNVSARSPTSTLTSLPLVTSTKTEPKILERLILIPGMGRLRR